MNVVFSFIEKIKKLIIWLPIIWNDKQDDYYFLYRILYFKLKLMDDYWEKEKKYYPEISKRIKIAKNLCKRLMEDNYIIDTLHQYHQKHPSEKEAERIYQKYIKHADYMEKQDREMLFNLLNKYIRWWWL